MFAFSTFVDFFIKIFILKAALFQKLTSFLLSVNLDRHLGEHGRAAADGVDLRNFDKLVDRVRVHVCPSSLHVSRSALLQMGLLVVVQALPHLENLVRQHRQRQKVRGLELFHSRDLIFESFSKIRVVRLHPRGKSDVLFAVPEKERLLHCRGSHARLLFYLV
jgi:hypothetical protein